MSDYIYVALGNVTVSEAALLEAKTSVAEACAHKVPHNLLSHLEIRCSYGPRGALLWPSLGSTSFAGIRTLRERRAYGIAIVEALIQWSRKQGWKPTLLLEGHRGYRPLPSEYTVTSSVEAALDSRPKKGAYAIRVLLSYSQPL
jgi:hypothetical protein